MMDQPSQTSFEKHRALGVDPALNRSNADAWIKRILHGGSKRLNSPAFHKRIGRETILWGGRRCTCRVLIADAKQAQTPRTHSSRDQPPFDQLLPSEGLERRAGLRAFRSLSFGSQPRFHLSRLHSRRSILGLRWLLARAAL